MTLPSIPRQFHKYLSSEYELSVIESIPTREIELWDDRYKVAKFYQNKSYSNPDKPTIKFIESIFFKIRLSDGLTRLLISRKNHLDLYLAGKLLEESNLTGPRVQKYITLFRAYESLTKSKERDIYLSSIRHSLTHSAIQLTHPQVVSALNELFGGIEIDLSRYKHKREFFLSYWRLRIEVDKLLLSKIETLLPFVQEYFLDIKIIP